jgi:hypothetical protein
MKLKQAQIGIVALKHAAIQDQPFLKLQMELSNAKIV